VSVETPREAIREWLAEPLRSFIADAGGEVPTIAIERSARPEHGDFALNAAFQLARTLRRKPLDIAGELAARLAPGGPVAAVEVAPPGFINLRLDDGWLLRRLPEVVAEGAAWGGSTFGGGQTVQVEFVSTNPTGPLLVSHGRGAVVGDTVARILAFTGHAVQREFYINDAGRQVELFGRSLLAAKRGDPVPEGGYEGAYVKELAANLPPTMLEGDPAAVLTAVTEWGVRHFLEEFREELKTIGVEFDAWFSERQLYGPWEQETMAELEARGLVSRHDGATWMVLPDKEDVLYKSTGDPTYFCGDLLYHRDKLVRRRFDRAIDVWGADHQNQVRRLKLALEAMGVEPGRLDIILIQLVHLRDERGLVKLSKRRGNIVGLRELVDAVGPDSTRYHYLLRSVDNMMDFDIALAVKQDNENPVFYAQYAHARLCSVRAVARESGITPDAGRLERLVAPDELALARELLELPEVVERAARELAPHVLPHYAQRLAERVHGWYHSGNDDTSLRIVVDDRELSAARLVLAEAARTTMANLLGLMGVSAPERM